MSDLYLAPCTVKLADAIAFNEQVHRRQPKVQGAMWAIQVRHVVFGRVGVALVGWPAKEWTDRDNPDTLCVLRVAVKEGYPNACSMLYGGCWRTARGQGATSMVTYTHLDEPGTSLRAAGWIADGETGGGEWSRPSRPRKKAVDSKPKRRWWAPGSIRRSAGAGSPSAGGVVRSQIQNPKETP